jgi:hypothetical protein
MKTNYAQTPTVIRSAIVGYVPAFSRGASLNKDYKVELIESEKGFTIVVFQPIKGEWHQTYSWYLDTLLEERRDGLSLDSSWMVVGMTPALALAEKIREDWTK